MIVAVSVYQTVLAIHIMAVVVAFGSLFAYPIAVAYARRAQPAGLPALHRVQQQLIQRLINPGLAVVLLAGIYLASKLSAFSSFYVGWGFVAGIALGAIAGGFLAPHEAQLAKLAERDLAAGGGELSREYHELSHRVGSISLLASLIVLATVFVMTAQLGA